MENTESQEVSDKPKKIDGRSRTSAANGAKGGRPEGTVKKIAPDDLIEAAQRVIAGTSVERMKCDFSLSHAQAKFLMATAGLTADEFRERLAERMENAISLCLARIIESVNEFELRDLSVTFGILNDHLLKMRGYATPATINQTNIQINGMERGAAMAMLSGKGGMVSNGANIGHNNRFTAPPPSETPARDLQAVSVATVSEADGPAPQAPFP